MGKSLPGVILSVAETAVTWNKRFVKLIKMKHVIADHKLKYFIPHVVLWKAVESLNLEVEVFCTSSAF